MNPDDFRYNELVPAPPVSNLIRPNVRAALDYLDNILSRGGQDAQDLWDVLTALRGPDEQNQEYKEDVTVPIRRAAFPLTNRATAELQSTRTTYLNSGPGVHKRASFGYSHGNYPFAGVRNDHRSNHFHTHGFRAARALGLI